MAVEYDTVPLGEVASVRSGFAFKSSDWAETGLPVVKIANVKDGRLVMGGCSFVPQPVADSAVEFALQAGDILIAMTGYIGDVAMVRDCDLPAALNQRVGRFVIRDRGRLDQRFLFYLLRDADIRKEIEGLGYGSAQPNISPSLIHGVEVPLPPLPEQRAIAHILGTLDDKIELNRQMNKTLESMARTLFKSWFVDFDPVRAKAEGRDTGLPKHIANLFPDSLEDSEVGEIPKGWPIVRLGDVADMCKGVGYDSKGLDAVDAKRLHNLNSVLEGGGYKYSGLKMWAGEHKQKHQVSAGDVVVASVEQGHDRLLLGFAAQIPDGLDGLASQDLFVVRPRDRRTTREYIASLINVKLQPQVSGYATGTTVNHLPVQALSDQLFALPPHTLVEKLGGTLAKMCRMNEVLHKECQGLAEIRDALLPRLVSGHLRVNAT